MEEVKRTVSITQGEYECLYEALDFYSRHTRGLGFGDLADRYAVLCDRIDDQISAQGGFEE